MIITLTTIATAATSVITWIISKKFILPYLVKAYEWIMDRKRQKYKENIDSSKELLEIKDKSNDVYENQLDFCMKQITELQNNLTQKQQELNDYINQLADLRAKIVELQKELYEYQLKNSKLSAMYCGNIDCKCRVTAGSECNIKLDR